MTDLVTRNYWWPEVTRDVGKYMDCCNMYQRIKNRIDILAEKLKLSKIPEKPQTHLTVDFITKLSLVAGKNAILVVYDKLSIVATTEGKLVKKLARLLRNNI